MRYRNKPLHACYATSSWHNKVAYGMKTGCERTEGFIRLGSPVFFSSHDKLNLSDMLIDMTISKCVNKVIEDNAYCDTGEYGI